MASANGRDTSSSSSSSSSDGEGDDVPSIVVNGADEDREPDMRQEAVLKVWRKEKIFWNGCSVHMAPV